MKENSLKNQKRGWFFLIPIILLILVSTIIFLSCKICRTGESVKHLSFETPVEVSNVKSENGEYTGDRSNTTMDGSKTESIIDTTKGAAFVLSYATTPTIKGYDTDLWIENRSKNVYAIQSVVIDPNTGDPICISPLLKPGTYVKNLKLTTKNVDTSIAYDLITYLYGLEEPYTLYSTQVSKITFSK